MINPNRNPYCLTDGASKQARNSEVYKWMPRLLEGVEGGRNEADLPVIAKNPFRLVGGGQFPRAKSEFYFKTPHHVYRRFEPA